MGLSLLLPGSGYEQKRNNAIARFLQIHAGSWVAPLRCPKKRNYYVHNRLLLFIDAFSFVH